MFAWVEYGENEQTSLTEISWTLQEGCIWKLEREMKKCHTFGSRGIQHLKINVLH